ncbi:putative serine/threonine-protein kinase-like [Capsicum annuum]|nr:putative serine/threonine-protein kinase-like [Capsicum annuum]
MAGSSSYKLDPGPLEPSVLTQQITHRSRDIWDGSADMILNTRKSDGSFWKLIEKYPIHLRVLEVIKLSGLYGVYRCNRPAIDRSLITSLVERWRPETHTFHFRTGFVPSLWDFSSSFLKVRAWERITVLRPQIVGKRGTGDIFPTDLRRGPHASRWFAHFSWTNTTKHVLKVYRDALDSMTEDQDVVEVHLPDRVMRQFGLQQVIPTPFLFDSTHFHHDRRGRPNTNWELEHAQWLPFWNKRITRLLIGNPNSFPQCQQGYMPNSTAYETMAHHIHSLVDKAKLLGDMPSYEDLYMFRNMVRDQSSDCLRYVHESNRIHVSSDYRRDEVQPDQLHSPIRRRGKDGVAERRERAIARDQVPIEMNEMDEAMQMHK